MFGKNFKNNWKKIVIRQMSFSQILLDIQSNKATLKFQKGKEFLQFNNNE